ncbi:hypothetical protein [Aquitalea sp.]|jgi:hypothetical protein|uniref:hypothetical protein n=1 Tax=Aquitalea sp. TaxID=1872623 RepID=UPI0025871352|nr:hypothetical protein [Aquitalea sp.]
MNLNQPVEPGDTRPAKEAMCADDVSYRGRNIRIFAIYHAGEGKWEGWSGISFTEADHFIGSYSGLLDLRATKEGALAMALYVAMAWLDAFELGLVSSMSGNALVEHAV